MWMFLGFIVELELELELELKLEKEVENDALAFRGHGRTLAILLLCSVPLS
jgi:hypothetical protein